jgi:uncharacterized protein YegJ (DUF2314 family)
MARRFVVLAMLLVGSVGCDMRKAGGPPKPSEDKVVMFEQDDPGMKAAIAKARASVDQFITALKSPKPRQSGFAVKKRLCDGEEVELFWLTQVTFDGKRFLGVVDNQPQIVKTVVLGQKETVPPEEICDWMYLDGRRLIGGQTLRVVRDRLSPKERVEFDKNMPLIYE